MTLKNTSARFGAVAKFFHWTVALLVIGLLCVGFLMTSLKISPFVFKLFFLHKSTGITVLALMALRLIWRIYNPPPHSLPNHQPWEKALAKASHWFLYIALFLMPLSGWTMSSAKNFHVSVFNLFTLPDLVAPDPALAEFLEEFHGYLAWGIIIVLGLHIAGALKHHILDKDATLRRMLPFGRAETNEITTGDSR